MKGPTLGFLWARYLRARKRQEHAGPLESRSAEREARALRDRLVVNYSPLVRYVAFRISGRAAGPVEHEEVLSWGLCGLLGAVETYDPSRRAKFETYAISKIRWSILDELRKADPLPRSARLRAQQVERVRSELSQALGRTPTEPEVADEMGVSYAKHRSFLARVARSHVGSFEARFSGEEVPGGLHELVADGLATDPESEAERAELRATLVRAIEGLGEQERVVTTFYYYEGLTLREIGRALDLTEGRISQILRAALIRLRLSLADGVRVSERV